MITLCIAAGAANAGPAVVPDGLDEADDISSRPADAEEQQERITGLPVEDERRQISRASRRSARSLKPGTARGLSRLVLVATPPAPAFRQPRTTAPDGQLYCWRRHANGQLAAIVGHADGTMTARLWPDNDVFSTGIRTLAAAQQAADSLAHRGSPCSCFRPWSFS